MGDKSYKVYCAGPLFNPKEQEEMQEIASILEGSRFKVFLPHRDGLEFANVFPNLLKKGITPQQAKDILNNAIFSLDVFHITDSDGLVLNMNGRVPDEGAMVEAGIAWACNKIVVIFRNDSRSLIEGNCNPMAMGLSDFSFTQTYKGILKAFEYKFLQAREDAICSREPQFDTTMKNGKQISEFIAGRMPSGDISSLLIDLFRERTCRSTRDQMENYTQAHLPQ